MAAAALIVLVLGSTLAAASPAFHRLPNTDITPCIGPCVRVGNCGYDTPNPKCNVTFIEMLCNATCGCVAFNSNGWLKGCGNTSCGISFEASSSTDTYILGNGLPPYTPSPPAPPVEDVYYPPEENAAQLSPAALSASMEQQWAVLQSPQGSKMNVSAGGEIFGFVLLAVIPLDPGAVVVLERTFERWGFIVFVTVGPDSVELARLRKGTGTVRDLRMPNYNALVKQDCTYYTKVAGGPQDWLAARIVNDTTDGEARYLDAIKYLAPQRDYAVIGAIDPYQKYSVSPDGRIKAADGAIYTPNADAADTGPGSLVWDPRTHLPSGVWPAHNFTYLKSALVGRFLRVVAVTAYEPSTDTGFEQIAFAPASEPSASVYVRLRAVQGSESVPFSYEYYNVSLGKPATQLDVSIFYAALAGEQELWNLTFDRMHVTSYEIPGQEGARQVDTAFGSLVASLSLFIGLQSNYGDGADYWSPQVDRGGSLPFQEIAVVQNLLDIGLHDMAAARLGWWMDAYINTDGSISTGSWELSCPFHFADGFADYGEMLDIFARTARAQLGYNHRNGSTWLAAHIDQAVRMANYSYNLRLAAKRNISTLGTPAAGLVWGPPEHDTCHSPGYYYHNQAWFIRGLHEIGRFFVEVCPAHCPAYASLGTAMMQEAALFQNDFITSINQTATFRDGWLVFIPPIAQKGIVPFQSMVESTLAEYSNFRYFSELLGADVLPPAWSVALQEFRENTFGSVGGITRWSDHLDDMPSSYYLAASLRDDRLERFFLLQYGHMANYMGRGTYTATEQLPIAADANGFYRDYLWSYLEGGIDECVPSIMLPAIATRWQFVLERYDSNILWLAKGAPRRWADPQAGGYGVYNAATRFGLVDIRVRNTALAVGQRADAIVGFKSVRVPGVSTTPQLAIRLLSSDPRDVLDPSSVVLTGDDVVVVNVDPGRSVIVVNMTTASSVLSFRLSAVFSH